MRKTPNPNSFGLNDPKAWLNFTFGSVVQMVITIVLARATLHTLRWVSRVKGPSPKQKTPLRQDAALVVVVSLAALGAWMAVSPTVAYKIPYPFKCTTDIKRSVTGFANVWLFTQLVPDLNISVKNLLRSH